jgi:sensor histidine kinase YesM
MSQEHRPAYRLPAVWALSFALATVAGALNAGSAVVQLLTHGGRARVWEPISWELTSNYSFALLLPFVIEFALRVQPSRHPPSVVIPAHAAGVVLFSVVHVGLMVAARKSIYAMVGGQYEFGNVGLELLYEGFKDTITYGFFVGLTYGFDYYRRYRRQELDASRLAASLSQARLENLEHRLQPHFLFNTLNLISATMHEDVDKADRMIARLSDLLRRSVQQRASQEVELHEELDTLGIYLDIMRARFEDRLEVNVVSDPAAATTLVPSFLLQPLVENAIKHGIAEREEGGRIDVQARTNGSRLVLSVVDDGPGTDRPAETLLSSGTGLSSTAERLRALYGDDHSLKIATDGGLSLTIEIPLRTAR